MTDRQLPLRDGSPYIDGRGFAWHLSEMPTTYGHLVSVHESSAATYPRVWLDIEGESHLREPARPFAGIEHGIARASTSAHLSLPQAREVHRALGEWIAEQEANDVVA